jgi:hypothetical protein
LKGKMLKVNELFCPKSNVMLNDRSKKQEGSTALPHCPQNPV